MLTKEEVLHVAGLAKLHLEPEEVEGFQKDLSSILDYFDDLQQIDTSTTPMIGHITGRTNEARVDVAERSAATESIQKLFPESQEGSLQVRSVFHSRKGE